MGLTADAPDKVARVAKKNGIGYPILHDPEATVMKALGTYNRWAPLRGHALPHPALAVMDQDGQVVRRLVRKRVIRRIGPDEILAILDGLP